MIGPLTGTTNTGQHINIVRFINRARFANWLHLFQFKGMIQGLKDLLNKKVKGNAISDAISFRRHAENPHQVFGATVAGCTELNLNTPSQVLEAG